MSECDTRSKSEHDLEDDGYATFRIGDKSVEVDLFKAWDELAEISRTSEEANRSEMFKSYLVGNLDFPEDISHRLVDKFIGKLSELCEGLKKKDGDPKADSGSADSPSSTG